MKQRLYYLDNICCLLIFHMIYTCHISNFCGCYKTSIIRIIYCYFSFFMAWFFFKGGMMHKETSSNSEMLKKSAKRLLVPFVIFLMIGVLLDGIILIYTNNNNVTNFSFLREEIDTFISTSILWPTAASWFLLSLFFARIVFNYLGSKIHPILITSFSICASLIIYYLQSNGGDIQFGSCNFHLNIPFYLGNMCHGLSLYSLGYYLKEKQFRLIFFIPALLLFLIKYFFPASIDIRANVYSGNVMLGVLYEIASCIFINNAFKKIANYKIPFVTYIGNNSMVYYLVHYPVLYTSISLLGKSFEDNNMWIRFFILSFIVTLSLIIAEWLFRNKRFRFIIGG